MIWDIAIARRFVHGPAPFEVDVRFTSNVSRLVLFGPSGAGKTQTLRLLAGIARPDHGRISIAEHVLYDSTAGIDQPSRERRLGYVFQDYALFPHLTVRQNIAFGRASGWLNPARSVSCDAVDRWLESFHLQSIAGHYPHQISGGQRQRTALARALVNDPAALLLDEPFSALDRKLRRSLRAELLDLQAELRIPTLLISHDDEDVRALGDAVVHIDRGRVVATRKRLAETPPVTSGSAAWRRPIRLPRESSVALHGQRVLRRSGRGLRRCAPRSG